MPRQVSLMAPDHASTRLAPADLAATTRAAAADGGTAVARHWATPPWLPVVVAVLAGLVSGFYRLGAPSPWRDEAATVDAAQRPVAQIFALLGHVDAVNGAYYLGLHPVIVFLGSSPAVIRAPSVLAMAATAGFTAALAGGWPRWPTCRPRCLAVCSLGCCWWPRRRPPRTHRTPGPTRS